MNELPPSSLSSGTCREFSCPRFLTSASPAASCTLRSALPRNDRFPLMSEISRLYNLRLGTPHQMPGRSRGFLPHANAARCHLSQLRYVFQDRQNDRWRGAPRNDGKLELPTPGMFSLPDLSERHKLLTFVQRVYPSIIRLIISGRIE